MRVKGLDGRLYPLALAGREVRADDPRERSAPHRYARTLLLDLFPFDGIYEEVPLPGCETSLFVDLMVPGRRLAVEVQGRQHREYVPHFHGSRAGHLQGLRRDRMKRQWLEANGWTLITLDDDDHAAWPDRLRSRLAGRGPGPAGGVGGGAGAAPVRPPEPG